MGLRPGRCYRNAKKGIKGHGMRGFRRKQKPKRAWSRVAVKVPRKNFLGATPMLKIRQFNMGNPTKKYDVVADLKVREGFDLRDNAIESVRMTVNRQLVKALGKDGFFMKVRVYPSNILRENKTAQGAGADRVSQGMSQSFGKAIGRSARVRKGQVIFSVLCMKEQKAIVKKSLMGSKAKFPFDVYVEFHKDIKKIGTIPTTKIREVVVETKVAEEKTEEGKKGEKKTEGKDKKEETVEGEEKKDGKEAPKDKKEEKKK